MKTFDVEFKEKMPNETNSHAACGRLDYRVWKILTTDINNDKTE